jgi:large subunit ribosomal protein L16
MLSPKRMKFRKYHRGKMRGKVFDKVCFGDYALQALQPGWITSRQIEAAVLLFSNYYWLILVYNDISYYLFIII